MCPVVTFALGLPVVGVGTGQGAVLPAVGYTGYGIGGVIGIVVARHVVMTPHPVRWSAAGWLVCGLAFVAIGLSPQVAVVGVVSACAGAANTVGDAATAAVPLDRGARPQGGAGRTGDGRDFGGDGGRSRRWRRPGRRGSEASLVGAGLLVVLVAAACAMAARRLPRLG